LRDLWDVDEAALANSEPKHLALAVRALANNDAAPVQNSVKETEGVPVAFPVIKG
jgi:hypothetical protein